MQINDDTCLLKSIEVIAQVIYRPFDFIIITCNENNMINNLKFPIVFENVSEISECFPSIDEIIFFFALTCNAAYQYP
jgi:hypothetical protein